MNLIKLVVNAGILVIPGVMAQCKAAGKQINVTGFIMDNFCIERGTLLDKPTVKSLQNPEQHTIHCLIDVPQCIKSGYAILAPPAKPGGQYSVGYQLGDEGTRLAVKEASRLRRQGAFSGLTLTFNGIDDGKGKLQCPSIVKTASVASKEGAGLSVDAFRSAHGSLMFIAWLVLVPVGVIFARYFKSAGHIWYISHVTIQGAASLMTFVAAALIFASIWPSTSFDAKTEYMVVTHASLGVIVVVIGCFIQPLMGKIADSRYEPSRVETPVFPDKVHWWMGRSIWLLAFVNVWLGVAVNAIAIVWWIVMGAVVMLGLLTSIIYLERGSNKNKNGHGINS